MSRQWMPMYWGDYVRDTNHLSTIEHGAYLLLISHYWSTGLPLPDDDNRLRIITRTTTKQWNLMKDEIKSFFERRDGVLVHKRISEELELSSSISTSQSRKAKQRWNNHKKQHQGTCRGIATAMPTTSTPISSEPKGSSDTPSPPEERLVEKTPRGKRFELPDWINADDWRDYEEMRTRIKKPLTDRARTENIRDLQRLRDAGEDVHEVISQTIKRCWAGFFSTKNRGGDREKGPVKAEGFETKNYMDGSDGFLI